MPRGNATTFDDLVGKLDVLRVTCEECGRDGRYRLDHLIERHGADDKIVATGPCFPVWRLLPPVKPTASN